MVLIGGLGRVPGPVIGAVLIVAVPRILQNLGGLSAETSAQLQQIIFGVLLILVVILRPKGLLPEIASPIVRRYMRRLRRGVSPAAPGAIPAANLEADLQVLASVGQEAVPAELAGDSGAPAGDVLTARQLRKKFGGLVVANGFDFSLPAGQIVGLVGPNGAGKTTLFNLLTGAIRPDSGAVSLFGTDITGKRIDQVVGAGMVRSFQDVRIIAGLTALENVFLGAVEARTASLWRAVLMPGKVRREIREALDRAYAALELVKLTPKAMELGGALSFGEQKLTTLARAIATEAQVLLLDEPAAGVGSQVAAEILALIGELGRRGRTILLVEHNLEVIKSVATSVYFLESGSIRAHGTYEELTSDPALAELYFGTAGTARDELSAPRPAVIDVEVGSGELP